MLWLTDGQLVHTRQLWLPRPLHDVPRDRVMDRLPLSKVLRDFRRCFHRCRTQVVVPHYPTCLPAIVRVRGASRSGPRRTLRHAGGGVVVI